DQIDAERDRVAWGRDANRLSIEKDASVYDRRQAEQRPPDAFLAGTAQTNQPDEFARADSTFERTRAIGRHAIEHQPRRTVMSRGPSEHLRWLPSDDEEDGFFGACIAHTAFSHETAVAENHHAICDLEYLVKTVRHVDHADAARAEAPQGAEQPGDLVG